MNITAEQLGAYVKDLGLLIGLLNDQGGGKVSVNTSWFSDPITELGKTPTRVTMLLGILQSLFDAMDGTEYSLVGEDAWYTLYGGTSEIPTGLCLVAPLPTSTSGVLGLGVFAQTSVEDLTVSTYARLPLFYLQEGAMPRFVLAEGPSDYQHIDIGIDAYSAEPVQVTGDAPFNLASLQAQAKFATGFATTFGLTFYQGFDPANPASRTAVPAPSTTVTIERIAALVLQAGYWLNSYIGVTPVTIGDVLSAAGLVTQTPDPTSGEVTYAFDATTLEKLPKDPATVLQNFLIALLVKLVDDMATGGTRLIPIENGGIFAVKDTATNTYGLRLTIPDYTLSLGPTDPVISIELGSWFSQEDDASNWIQKTTGTAGAEPGISVFFLTYDGHTLSTTAHFRVESVGVNVAGPGAAPLVNLGGYTLQAAEMRFSLDSANWNYGFGIRLDDVGVPLGPSFSNAQSGSGGSNTVAQNLLASGDSSGSSDQDAANPAFSAIAAYVKDKSPLFEILDLQGNQTDLAWFPIQRRLGPLTCRKVGLGMESGPLIELIFDGGIALGGLDVDLDELSIGVPLKRAWDPSGYQLDLQGLEITFSSGSVEVSAGLRKTTDAQGYISYDGEALIRTANLTIAALGAYSSLPNNGGTSLFIFAVLNYPIGGPSFFFITGLMAGFGYNRALQIPTQSNFQEFPLLAGLVNPSAIGGENPSPAAALATLEEWVPPQRGEYWLAAGVQFTTFEIIKTNALLVVEFGNELIISVLGTSTLKQPQEGEAWVYAQLDLAFVFLPDEGELQVSAVLAPGSYVLTQKAHLTGGFAFYSWFGSNENAGDFVYTVGGYHPAFIVPPHYPSEPRLGINWQISDSLALTGDAYFAITPVAMMAGGGLQITFSDGPLRAWLKAQADVILYWKPFYLVADVSVSVGVSFRMHFLFVDVTISVEIGAEFHLWGPPIGGTVHIDWYIISFTIGFGANRTGTPPLSWNDFKGMLPTKPPTQTPHLHMARADALEATMPGVGDSPLEPLPLHITANDGLKRAQTVSGLTMWLVRAADFRVTVGSAIPAKVIQVTGIDDHDKPLTTTFDNNSTPATPKVGLRNVQGGVSSDNYQSTQTIAIVRLDADKVTDEIAGIRACMVTTPATVPPTECHSIPEDMQSWEIDLVTSPLPQAMWGDPATSQSTGINPDKPTVLGATGVTLHPTVPDLVCTPQMKITQVFSDRIINPGDTDRLSISETATPVDNTPTAADSFADIAGINSGEASTNRNALFLALQALGVNGWTNDELPLMAANPWLAFADEPLEGSPAPSVTSPVASS